MASDASDVDGDVGRRPARVSEDSAVAFARTFDKVYLVIGHGASGLFHDPEKALSDTMRILEADLGPSSSHGGDGGGAGETLVMFGGDPARDEAPDLGWLIREVRSKLGGRGVRCMAVQYWEETQPWVDHLLLFKQQEQDFKPDGRPFYGGCNAAGEAVAATRFYLDPAMQELMTALICVGGGPISLSEYQLAIDEERGGVKVQRHHYIPARSKRIRQGTTNPYGPVDDWLNALSTSHE